jgi:hypothetical protein
MTTEQLTDEQIEQAVQQINGDTYVDAVLRSECSYDGAADRLEFYDVFRQLEIVMERSITVGRLQNSLKRHVFYGKEAHFVSHPELKLRDPMHRDQLSRLRDPKVIRLLHAGVGMQTEASEFQQQLYAHIFHGRPLDEVNLAEEAGDSAWYIGLACSLLELPLVQLLRQNIAKLLKRFPEKFTELLVGDRDLKAERQTLEKHHAPKRAKKAAKADESKSEEPVAAEEAAAS